MLVGKLVLSTPAIKNQSHDEVENDLDRHSRPAGFAGLIGNGVPCISAFFTQTASMQETSNSTNDNPSGRDGGEPIARNLLIPKLSLRPFHPEVAAEKRSDNGLSRGQL